VPGSSGRLGWNSSCFQKCQWVGNDFKLLFNYCLERVSREELDLTAVVARHIWLRRNSLIFNGTFTHPNVVFPDAEKSLIEFKRCQIKESGVMLDEVYVPCNRNVKWQPPPHGL
jgi:hypothetical protein